MRTKRTGQHFLLHLVHFWRVNVRYSYTLGNICIMVLNRWNSWNVYRIYFARDFCEWETISFVSVSLKVLGLSKYRFSNCTIFSKVHRQFHKMGEKCRHLNLINKIIEIDYETLDCTIAQVSNLSNVYRSFHFLSWTHNVSCAKRKHVDSCHVGQLKTQENDCTQKHVHLRSRTTAALSNWILGQIILREKHYVTSWKEEKCADR